jgi:hypothetical protein
LGKHNKKILPTKKKKNISMALQTSRQLSMGPGQVLYNTFMSKKNVDLIHEQIKIDLEKLFPNLKPGVPVVQEQETLMDMEDLFSRSLQWLVTLPPLEALSTLNNAIVHSEVRLRYNSILYNANRSKCIYHKEDVFGACGIPVQDRHSDSLVSSYAFNGAGKVFQQEYLDRLKRVREFY